MLWHVVPKPSRILGQAQTPVGMARFRTCNPSGFNDHDLFGIELRPYICWEVRTSEGYSSGTYSFMAKELATRFAHKIAFVGSKTMAFEYI